MLHELRRRIREKGRLSFAEVMEVSLYHPEGGYYSACSLSLDRTGDFTTCANLHPALAQAVGAWAVQHGSEFLEKCGGIIELGGGTGSFAQSLVQSLPSSLRSRLTYHFVELNESLESLQRKALDGLISAKWYQKITDIHAKNVPAPLLIANEFLDTFPVRLAEWHAGNWWEVFIECDTNQQFVEVLAKPQPPFEASCTSLYDATPLRDAQRVELRPSLERWLSQWSSQWERALWVIIDYGDYFPQLYHRRPWGTLRTYGKHRRYQGLEVYLELGRRDMTADINFSDLTLMLQRNGWQVILTQEQGSFVRANSPLPIQDYPPLSREADAYHFITSPLGAGNEFKILWCQK